jgi:drug/metabolite transporter (DMT)-like permease
MIPAVPEARWRSGYAAACKAVDTGSNPVLASNFSRQPICYSVKARARYGATDMDPFVVSIVLAAAVFHASWNAVVKSSGDRLISMAIILGMGAIMSFPAVFFLPLPDPASWPWLIASVILHVPYNFLLARAYSHGDLSHIYPIARGSAPLYVALLAALFFGEILNTGETVAIIVICGGILSLAVVGQRHSVGLKPLAYALLIGFLIGLYTVADGVGVRRTEVSFSYIAWLFLIQGVVIMGLTTWRRWGVVRSNLRKVWRASATGGLVANFAYGMVIWAMSLTPMAHVSTLRETSVIVAALIGTKLLGEPGGSWRVVAAAIVALGIIGLQFAASAPA